MLKFKNGLAKDPETGTWLYCFKVNGKVCKGSTRAKRNIADKDRIKQFSEQQGVTLFEVQGSDSQLLFSQDPRVKDLGARIIRDFYRLDQSTKVMVVEGQG